MPKSKKPRRKYQSNAPLRTGMSKPASSRPRPVLGVDYTREIGRSAYNILFRKD